MQIKNGNWSLTLRSTYRPPNSNAMEFTSNLEESIQKLSTNEQLLIAGDFNAHHVDWLESDDTDTCGELLSELFNTYSLDQIVHFPTNLHLGKLKGCIDLIATNISQINLTSSSPLGKSDHVVLIGTISNLVPSMKPSRYIWCWNKANVHGLQEAISKESWCDILDCEDVDIAWTRWRPKILYYANKFIQLTQLLSLTLGCRMIFDRRLKQSIDSTKPLSGRNHRLFGRSSANSEIVFANF